jgi:hypothetical protein
MLLVGLFPEVFRIPRSLPYCIAEIQQTMERTIHYPIAGYRLVRNGSCLPLTRKSEFNLKSAREIAPPKK